jgi:hypothetical protein
MPRDKDGQMLKRTAFYVGIGNGTREITDPAQKQKYIAGRWSRGQDAAAGTSYV